MKTKILITMMMFTFASVFVACSGGGGEDSTPVAVVLEDITLGAGGSSICTNATSFTVTPTDDPDVVFTTDAESGDTTISVEAGSAGFVLIQNCTTK